MSVIATRDLVYCRHVLGRINFRRMACRTDGRAGALVSEMPTVSLQASVAWENCRKLWSQKDQKSNGSDVYQQSDRERQQSDRERY